MEKNVCTYFTLQEHAWLQTALLHLNEKGPVSTYTNQTYHEGASYTTIPNIDDVWQYAEYLYTPDTIEVTYSNGDSTEVERINSFNLELSKDRIQHHLTECKTCKYNKIQCMYDTLRIASESAKHEKSKSPDWILLYKECLKRIVCTPQFNGGPLLYINAVTQLVASSTLRMKGRTNVGPTYLRLNTLSSNVCVGSTIKLIKTNDGTNEMRKHIRKFPVVKNSDLGLIEVTNKLSLNKSLDIWKNPKMNEIKTHISKFRVQDGPCRGQDGPCTNTFLSILGMACSGKGGKIANRAKVGVAIRWGNMEDVKLIREKNETIFHYVDEKLKINWITITFDSRNIQKWTAAIQGWLQCLPPFHSKVFSIPKSWRAFKIRLNRFGFKTIVPHRTGETKRLILQHDYFSKEHTHLWRYIRNKKVVIPSNHDMKKNGTSGNDTSNLSTEKNGTSVKNTSNQSTEKNGTSGKNKVTNFDFKPIFFEPISISRNIFKCKARYHSEEKNSTKFTLCIDESQVNIANSENLLKTKLKLYAIPKNRIIGIGLKLLSSIETATILPNGSCEITVTPDVMGNIPNTKDKLMDVIIEKVCNGCKYCQNFTKQRTILQKYESLSYNDFKEFYNMWGVDMSAVMTFVLDDHMKVERRRTETCNVKRKRTIGLAGNFYQFVQEHNETFFTYGESKKTKRQQWNRISSVSWRVVADVFNKTKYANNDPVTSDALRKTLSKVNNNLHKGKISKPGLVENKQQQIQESII